MIFWTKVSHFSWREIFSPSAVKLLCPTLIHVCAQAFAVTYCGGQALPRVYKRFQHAAVEAAQNVPHQIDGAVGQEIGAVNISDVRFEETRAIHVPGIICWRRRICQGRTTRKTAATKTPHPEMLQACRRAEDSIASAIECRDPVGEISHSIAIVVVRCSFVEQIAVHVGRDHYQLIDETNE